MLFDYVEKEFKPSTLVDPIINLQAPLSGFLFPAFNDNAADVNHLLYSAGKANEPSWSFIDEVLDCEEIITAAEDKDCFEQILVNVIGDEVDSRTISSVYEEIDKLIQESEEDKESEPPMLDFKDVSRILEVSGVENVDTAKVEHAFKEVVSDETHEFKASNVVPKNIKIKTNVANVSMSSKDLSKIRYITYEGKRCLLVEIDEDVVVEGFKLESETFGI